MPDCAEKTTLNLLQQLLQRDFDDFVDLSHDATIEKMLEKLKFQLTEQHLNSQPVIKILIDINLKNDISDVKICLRKLFKEIGLLILVK